MRVLSPEGRLMSGSVVAKVCTLARTSRIFTAGSASRF
jgi:hypothetical protein